jgi:hypothetical protein
VEAVKMKTITLALVGLTSAHVASAQVVQSVRGSPDHFGPGFTNLYETRVEFRLLRPGNAVLLWVKPTGEVDLYYPLRSRDKTERREGRHSISTAEIPSPIQAPVISGVPSSARAGQFTPAGVLTAATEVSSDSVSGYWVLLVTDVPVTAVAIKNALGPMSHEGSAAAMLERLAPLLVPEGATWAMYTAAVVVQ